MSIFSNKNEAVLEAKQSDLKDADPFNGATEVTAYKVMQDKEKMLTLLGTWRHKGLQSKEAEAQLAVLTQKIIQAQTEYLDHQLKIGLDKRKKEDYSRYLQEIEAINKDIVTISASAARNLINTSFDIDVDTFHSEAEQIERFKEMHSRGIIDKDKLQEQIAKIRAANNGVRRYGQTMIDKIIMNSMETFDHTLKLFDENRITML